MAIRSGFLLHVICAMLLGGNMHAQGHGIHLQEMALRKYAKHIIMPIYPNASIASRSSGVAVVGILVNEKGRVIFVQQIQAPDRHIAKAVEEAVREWIFSVPDEMKLNESEGRMLTSKLTFYFQIKDKHPTVLNPADFSTASVTISDGKLPGGRAK
jgi:hypothetical protein